MIKLKNVSKYYYNHGNISTGFNKLNIEFNIGEFVVITGESGSGKSTLLNVLSGLDSYEEGEMYINGEETSHYGEKDFEIYRQKYISNIFQNFNLVNSYTVYQNIELACLINGAKKKDVKKEISDLIKLVNLEKYKNTKVSKLSGGQKQRVAIARALAKNTPIIIADEPTGNLDKKSAEIVMKTLYEVSHNKLVIIVTHNYEQVSNYATRKVTMFDGKIIEDKQIAKAEKVQNVELNKFKPISRLNEIRLSLRNTFNIFPKFILLLAVFLFMVLAILSETASFIKSKYESNKVGYNDFFYNTSDTRIIVNKKDKTPINNSDYELIQKLNNVDYIVKNDLSLDSSISINSEDFYFDGSLYTITENLKLDYGRMPINDNEIIIEGSNDNYYFENIKDNLNTQFNIYDGYIYSEINKIRIVGVIENPDLNYNIKFYGNDRLVDKISRNILLSRSNLNITMNNQSINYQIVPIDNVPEGKVYIPTELNYMCDYNYCINKQINFKLHNLYYDNEITLKVSKMLNKNNYYKLTGMNYDEYNYIIYLNPNDYLNLLPNDYYQSSVFVENPKIISETKETLNENGYNAYVVSDMLITAESVLAVLNILNVVVTAILLVVLFFISYLIIKLILKSRNFYFTVLRILGSNTKSLKRILSYELITVLNIAYIIIITLIILINNDVIVSSSLKDLISFTNLNNYVIIYIILLIMTYLISIRFSNYIFKKSAMKQIVEEVN